MPEPLAFGGIFPINEFRGGDWPVFCSISKWPIKTGIVTMIRSSILGIFLLAASMAKATTYYVALDGNDAHPGTELQPVRTVAKGMQLAQPGDTVLLGPGYYNEALVAVRDGAANQYITVDGQGVATVLRVAVGKPYHRLQNLTVSGYTTKNGKLLNLARGGHYCVVSNVVVDVNMAQGVVGISWENPSTKPFGPDAASNCLLVSNRVTGVLGTTVISVYGASNRLIGNYIHDVGAADFMRLWGETNWIVGNTFSNNFKVEGVGNHVDFIQTFGNNQFGSWGHVLEGNRVVKVAGQLSQLEGNVVPEIGYWTFRNNLFIDIDLQASCSVPGIAYYNNTFLRCNQVNGSHVLGFGSRAYTDPARHHTIGTNYAHGAQVLNNVFLDCGDLARDNRGWYSVSKEITNCVADYNFVAKNGYGAVKQGTKAVGEDGYDTLKWFEYHGINGGNPGFVDEGALDLRLVPNRPLLGAGTNLSFLFGADKQGAMRGSHWDIGAFQFQPGATDRPGAEVPRPSAPGGLRLVLHP